MKLTFFFFRLLIISCSIKDKKEKFSDRTEVVSNEISTKNEKVITSELNFQKQSILNYWNTVAELNVKYWRMEYLNLLSNRRSMSIIIQKSRGVIWLFLVKKESSIIFQTLNQIQ